MWYDLILNKHLIVIEHLITEDRKIDGAIFYYLDGFIHSLNISCGDLKRVDLSVNDFNKHIEQMMNEKNTIHIYNYTNKNFEYCKKYL